jgi:peptide/nickel transport system ATP-binding protein
VRPVPVSPGLQRALGVSYLFITHDLDVVRSIADRVVVMHRGRIVDQGSREEVFSPPYPAYTKLLLDSVPEVTPDWLDRKMAQAS